MNEMKETSKVICIDPKNIEKSKIISVVSYLKEGKVVAFPTDTVYGLGADIEDEMAVRRIFYIKNRSFNKPLMLLISNIDEVSKLAKDISSSIYKLINKYWPGPLTIILKARRKIFGITSDDQKIALRVPDSKIALTLIKEFGKPITAPSANLSGEENLITAEEVKKELGDKVDLIVDGGQCKHRKPSTIIDLSCAKPILLREGSISFMDIMSVYEG
ncbi:MAG: L-threonylcarbamoyladenylate synthase [bacterium]|nr:L-threonylcarbamoyladenylate synthase [bacterium]